MKNSSSTSNTDQARELAKSLTSAGVAGILFGVKQLSNLATGSTRPAEPNRTTEAINSVAQAAAAQCGESMRATFHTLDRIQREAIDTGFKLVSLESLRSNTASNNLTSFARQAGDQLKQWLGQRADCGCGGEDSWNDSDEQFEEHDSTSSGP